MRRAMIDHHNPDREFRCALRCFGFKKDADQEPETSQMKRPNRRKERVKTSWGKRINKHIRVDEEHWKRIEKQLPRERWDFARAG